MAIIGIDIDGTLFDVLTPVLKEYNLRHNTNYKVDDITQYKIQDCTNIDKNEFYEILSYVWLTNWEEIRPYDIFVNNYFHKLRNICGHKIVIVTKRDLKTIPNVINLLKKWGITVDGIICINNGLKKAIANIDILLDDSAEAIEDFQGIGVLIKRPYNPIYQVQDMKDFYEKILSSEIHKKESINITINKEL